MIAGAMAMPPPAAAAWSASAAGAGGSGAPPSAIDPRPSAPPAETAPVKASGQQSVGKAADTEGRESDFDALLSDAGAPATVSGPPTAFVLPSAGSTAPGPAEPPVEPVSPDHLLALLDGRWAQPTPPAAAAIGAPQVAAGTSTVTGGIPQSTTGAGATAGTAAGTAAGTDAGTAAGAASMPPVPAMLERREADLAGRMVEIAESSLMRETGSTEPAPLTAPTAIAANGAIRSPSLVQTAPIPLPVDPDAGFDDAFGSRITWMAEQRMGHAEIRVTPDHAGPIDVRLQIDGTRISADFQSTSPEVRHALEASMARLREMLEQQGLQLAHAGVGNGHSSRRGAPDMGHGHDPGREAELDPRMSANPVIRSSRGLLDEYA